MFNLDAKSPVPPRPPRYNSPVSSNRIGDIEAAKKALHLPSVTAALASRTPEPKIQVTLKSAEDKAVSSEGLQPEVEVTCALSFAPIMHQTF